MASAPKIAAATTPRDRIRRSRPEAVVGTATTFNAPMSAVATDCARPPPPATTATRTTSPASAAPARVRCLRATSREVARMIMRLRPARRSVKPSAQSASGSMSIAAHSPSVLRKTRPYRYSPTLLSEAPAPPSIGVSVTDAPVATIRQALPRREPITWLGHAKILVGVGGQGCWGPVLRARILAPPRHADRRGQRGVGDEVITDRLEPEHRAQQQERRPGRPRLRAAGRRVLDGVLRQRSFVGPRR